MMDEGHTVDVIYLDFAKAFESVSYRFLLAKMKSFCLGDVVSVIGPLLFLLFVNDLPDVFETLTLLFADDIKIVTRRSQSMNCHSSLTAA